MTANLRLIFDNAADRGTLTASSTAGALAATNMQVDEKAAVWRSAAAVTTATLTLTWSTAETLDSIALAWTNLSTVATMRVRGYRLPNDAATLFDLTVNVCAQTLGDLAWGTEPLGGGGAWRTSSPMQAMVWLAAAYQIRKLVVDIVDAYATGAYIEASRLVAGTRFEPGLNMSYGLQVDLNGRANPERAESGDLRVEVLSLYRGLSLNLDWLRTAADRNAIARMAQRGRGRGVWVSCFADWADTSDQQFGSFYAGLMDKTGLALALTNNWRAPLRFEEMA